MVQYNTMTLHIFLFVFVNPIQEGGSIRYCLMSAWPLATAEPKILIEKFKDIYTFDNNFSGEFLIPGQHQKILFSPRIFQN